jgi:hypothetical protein
MESITNSNSLNLGEVHTSIQKENEIHTLLSLKIFSLKIKSTGWNTLK